MPGDPLTGPVDPDAAEVRWCAYAWPVAWYAKYPEIHRVFLVDASGGVWQTSNLDRRYVGSSAGPSWDAAMPEDGWGAGWAPPRTAVADYRGRDGNTWRRVQ